MAIILRALVPILGFAGLILLARRAFLRRARDAWLQHECDTHACIEARRYLTDRRPGIRRPTQF